MSIWPHFLPWIGCCSLTSNQKNFRSKIVLGLLFLKSYLPPLPWQIYATAVTHILSLWTHVPDTMCRTQCAGHNGPKPAYIISQAGIMVRNSLVWSILACYGMLTRLKYRPIPDWHGRLTIISTFGPSLVCIDCAVYMYIYMYIYVYVY